MKKAIMDLNERLRRQSEWLRRQSEWSGRTFGPGRRLDGVLDHMAKEIEEVRESGGDLSEWVDLIILSLDGAWRSGATPEQVTAAIQEKQIKNEGAEPGPTGAPPSQAGPSSTSGTPAPTRGNPGAVEGQRLA